jgi:hypothetical protein
MARALRSAVVVLGSLLLLGASTPPKTSLSIDPYDLFGSLRRLQRSSDPAARAFLRQIDQGARDLALQRAAARREGIPLSGRDLVATHRGRNAAILYSQLAQLMRQKPLDQRPAFLASTLGSRYAFSADELAAVRQMLAARHDVTDLLHQAADSPFCVLPHDWAKGAWDAANFMPYYATMREAGRLLKAESYLLAKQGQYSVAVRNQARGFRITEHTAADPLLNSYFVGIAIDGITLDGMKDILSLAGANAQDADQVRQTVIDHHPRFSLRHALGGEVVMNVQFLQKVRQFGPEKFPELWATEAEQARGKQRKPQPHRLTPAEQKQWSLLCDAAEASYLKQVRPVIAAAEMPYPLRRERLRKARTAWTAQTGRPMSRLLRYTGLDLDLALADQHRISIDTQANVVAAGAALLFYKARRGTFPARLNQALPVPPLDPFSGRPLKYRREGSGFVVYSVGPSGTFSGEQGSG